MPGWLKHHEDGITLALRVQPRASRDEVSGLYGDRLKLRITSPPIEGAANEHVCRFIASLFGVPRSRVRLLKGQGARDKLVAVAGVSALPEPLARLAGGEPAQGPA